MLYLSITPTLTLSKTKLWSYQRLLNEKAELGRKKGSRQNKTDSLTVLYLLSYFKFSRLNFFCFISELYMRDKK